MTIGLDQVFETNPITIVYQAGFEERTIQSLATYISQRIFIQGRFRVNIISELELQNLDSSKNYIYLGLVKPSTFIEKLNEISDKVQGLVSYRRRPSFVIGGTEFAQGGVMYLSPTLSDGLIAVLTGHTMKSLRRLVDFLPMLSATLNGDYLVIPEDGNEIKAFGYWSNEWKFDDRIGFVSKL